jgi:hypothetical protein
MCLAISVLVGIVMFVGAFFGLALLTTFWAHTLDELVVWIWPGIDLSVALGVLSFLLAWRQLNRARS